MLILMNQISRSIDLLDSYRNHKVTFAESQHVQFKKIANSRFVFKSNEMPYF